MIWTAILFLMSGHGSVEITAQTLPLYNKQGQELKRVQRKQFKTPKIDVEGGANEYGHLPIRFEGEIVYVRRTDVKYSDRICITANAPASGQNKRAIGDPEKMGMKKGAGSEDQSCVRR